MSFVRFASICDKDGCGARSEEYSAWPNCRNGDCQQHTCPAHMVPGSVRSDVDVYDCLCLDCQAEYLALCMVGEHTWRCTTRGGYQPTLYKCEGCGAERQEPGESWDEIRRAGQCRECGSVQRAHRKYNCASCWHFPEEVSSAQLAAALVDSRLEGK